MDVKIYTDIACPFCYIGKKNFEKALAEYKTDEKINIEYASYELDNQAPKEPQKNIYEVLAAKHEQPMEEIERMVSHIVEQGKISDIEFNMDKVIPANTRDAHRLLKLSYEFGLEEGVLESLYRAYFTEGKNVSDKDVLLEIAKANGMPEVPAKEVINDPSLFLENVIGDFNMAKVNKVRTLPYYIFDDKFAISGAREPRHYTIALNKTLMPEE
ncbi:DSBA-like thioredoxin domain protein [Jeotgalicoccus saudimassiliensis]|uniref:DSBA-like thioredoxin domain protein n=1 Tax=Jeotgalicoccus saudimassiliensis TaxID=1461582 RepID=A0A078LY76_9STAP|nr:DsbA family oxidoreductase [Jeotgalicoccus saudimassiliensis]CDZ98924.1 DSBA-like thioredoxin domain protein [Jeotgalicoccus saudimassiliensis]